MKKYRDFSEIDAYILTNNLHLMLTNHFFLKSNSEEYPNTGVFVIFI